MILQRYTFGSKSQLYKSCEIALFVAYDIAKIYIWKQITTFLKMTTSSISLLMILQRYTFGSKSQHNMVNGCFLIVAYDIAKIYIWKQITTKITLYFYDVMLLMILQRYTFGSKSQQRQQDYNDKVSCL